MTRLVLYMCHPVAPTTEEIQATNRPHSDHCAHEPATMANVKRAMRWLAWLRRTYPDVTFIAPWIAGILSGQQDWNPEHREKGLVDACAAIALCDGVTLVGGRLSSGIHREVVHGVTESRRVIEYGPGSFDVVDMNVLGREPPADGPVRSLDEYRRTISQGKFLGEMLEAPA